MPLSDAVDYPYEMFRLFAEHGRKVRREVTWKRAQEIPEDIFLDFVLFHRVNTESLTFCRELFAAPLWERVREKDMEAAILEANYWCAEEATYQATEFFNILVGSLRLLRVNHINIVIFHDLSDMPLYLVRIKNQNQLTFLKSLIIT